MDNLDTTNDLTQEKSAIKQKLGQVGRKLKSIDARSAIVDNPYAAIGIAAGLGAVVGLIRPMPKRGIVGSALMSTLSFVGFRLLREAAMTQLGNVAHNLIGGQKPAGQQTQGFGAQGNAGGNVRYTPAL
jgi:hypothetical protein